MQILMMDSFFFGTARSGCRARVLSTTNDQSVAVQAARHASILSLQTRESKTSRVVESLELLSGKLLQRPVAGPKLRSVGRTSTDALPGDLSSTACDQRLFRNSTR